MDDELARDRESMAGVIVPDVPIPDGANPVSSVSTPVERFARSAGWVLGSSILSSMALGIGAVLTARELGPRGRGELVLLLTVATFTTLITSLGLNIGARIHLVSPDEPVALSDFIGLSALLSVVGGWAAYGISYLLLPFAGLSLGGTLGVWLALYATSLLAALFTRDMFVAHGRNKRSSTMDAVGNLGTLAVIVFLVISNQSTVESILAAFVFSGVLQLLLGIVFLRRDGLWATPRLSKQASRTLLKTGLPGIAHNLGLTLTYRLDRYLVGLYLGPAAVGIYAVAATATELLRLPAYAISQVFFHRLASGAWNSSQLTLVLRYALGLAVLGGIPLFLGAPWIVETVFGPEFSESVVPLRILIAAEVGMAAFLVFQTALSALVSTTKAALAAMFGLMMVTIADVLLIPPLEVEGAAIASAGAYALMALAAFAILRRALVR